MRRIAILASGSGSNAENINTWFSGSKLAKVSLILTDNPHAFVLERAQRMGIEALVFTPAELRSGIVLATLQSKKIDFVVLAGFLKLIPVALVEAYRGKIINIHPALLPKFGGKGMYGDRVHKAVVDAGETESGITIHYVNEHYDEGHIVFQAKCTVSIDDTPEMVAQKVHALEYAHYPRVIEELISNLDTQ
ncbi:phosphoribosylglycinamide formyltransferase [Perlabentimonas gracilis]|uniref:phosphoribosylglycinamide formyltransferase n=1 Tax=Perlabentimonas gracilis TaxID=2715279 RepID=UPI0014076A65|nr:phosphoribosylglycinamide formyltransferase [Perlabentimonas gracilis]NHB69943.1 phosphoribosylglycinamide formyltransferase [Perlabentimonas gracilis]